MKLSFHKKKKKSVLDERIVRLQRELSAVRGEMRALAKDVDESGAPQVTRPPARYRRRQEPPWESEPPPPSEAAPEKPVRPVSHERSPEEIKSMYEKRFADYLASSFQQMPPLRHERSIQRNKALFMVAFAVVILILLWRLLFP
jgi:hypothetical protein